MKQLPKALIIFVIVACSSISRAQIGSLVKVDSLQFQEVLEAESVTFYGIDFSNLELHNTYKVNTEAQVRPYVAIWQGEVYEHQIADGWLERQLYKKIRFSTKMIDDRSQRMEGKFISSVRHPLLLDSVQNILNNYQFSDTSNAIGFIVIVETLDKPQEVAYVNFVFFNTKSKQVIWRVKAKGTVGTGGMAKHWGTAIDNAFRLFYSHYDFQLRKMRRIKRRSERKERG